MAAVRTLLLLALALAFCGVGIALGGLCAPLFLLMSGASFLLALD
jgi:hypothetical protein